MKLKYLLFLSCGVLLLNLTSFAQLKIAGGEQFAVAICKDSTVKSVGRNNHGQLGDGTNINSLNFIDLGPVLGKVKFVSAGQNFVHFIKPDGSVWAVGKNSGATLGDGTTISKNSPVLISGLSNITAASSTYGGGVLFLKNDGTVYKTGNMFGTIDSFPVLVPGINNVKAIAGGSDFGVFLKNDSTVWSMGYNSFGQLGTGNNSNSPTTPVQVAGLSSIKAIAVGAMHVLCLKNDGTVWACGANDAGQLGDGTTTDRNSPVQVSGLSNITAIAANFKHSLFLKSDSTVWACGFNVNKQLGDGTNVNRSTPIQVSGINKVNHIAAGPATSYFVRNDTIWSVGSNFYGELGLGYSGLAVGNATQALDPCINNTNAISPNQEINATLVRLFPNPNNGQFIIETNENSTFQLCDITGKVLETYQVNQNLNVSEHLPSGIYLLKHIKSGKVIKLVIQ